MASDEIELSRPAGSTPSAGQELDSSDAKLEWELRKLQAEVRALERPFRTPSVVVTVTTAIVVAVVSVAGTILQWSRSERTYELAQIRTERLELKREQLTVDAARLAADTARLEHRQGDLATELAARNAQLQRAFEQLAQMDAALRNDDLTASDLRRIHLQLRDVVIEVTTVSKPITMPGAEMGVTPGAIRRGETATLNWSSIDADEIVITPGIGAVPPSGQRQVSPEETTTYKITVTNRTGGHAMASVTLRVTD